MTLTGKHNNVTNNSWQSISTRQNRGGWAGVRQNGRNKKNWTFQNTWPFALQTRTQSPSGGEKTFSITFVPQPVENHTLLYKNNDNRFDDDQKIENVCRHFYITNFFILSTTYRFLLGMMIRNWQ